MQIFKNNKRKVINCIPIYKYKINIGFFFFFDFPILYYVAFNLILKRKYRRKIFFEELITLEARKNRLYQTLAKMRLFELICGK